MALALARVICRLSVYINPEAPDMPQCELCRAMQEDARRNGFADWRCVGCDSCSTPVPLVDRTPDTKPTNPKDAIGSGKVPFHLWPETATMAGAMALLEGASKYGRANWREAGVRASIYYDAARRHLMRWFEGEDFDSDSGLPHLGHALACMAILVDAEKAGKLVDDRNYSGQGAVEMLHELTPDVAKIKAHYIDRNPKHWTIQDEK